MPIAKNSTDALMSLRETMKRVINGLIDIKLRLDYLCYKIEPEWKDEVGQHFFSHYHQSMEIFKQRILPNFDKYIIYLNQLVEIVNDYNSTANDGTGIIDAPENPLSPSNKFTGDNDQKFIKDTEERIHRIAEYAMFLNNQQNFSELDKEILKNKLEDAMRREDSIAYHKYRLSHPNSSNLNDLKRETTINIIDEKENLRLRLGLSMSNPAHYKPGFNIINVYKKWWDTESDNSTLFGAIMHEYEHKQQNDAYLRCEVTFDAMEPAKVDSVCIDQLNNMANEEIKPECEEQLNAYYDEPKERRSFKAGDIAEGLSRRFYKPKVKYRTTK